MYAAHFPITENDPALCQAMRIAMDYAHGTGLVDKIPNPEMLLAAAISNAWQGGIRHPIRLANEGIVCAERTAELGTLPSMFTRLI
jgi:hypothetical protein